MNLHVPCSQPHYKHEQWNDIRSFAIIKRERTKDRRTSIEHGTYYISSLPAGAT